MQKVGNLRKLVFIALHATKESSLDYSEHYLFPFTFASKVVDSQYRNVSYIQLSFKEVVWLW